MPLTNNQLAADEKVCEHCGRTYSRQEVARRQSLRHWKARRFCTDQCRRASRALENPSGDQHPSWKGAEATAQAGRKRARKLYSTPESCERCGEREAKIERHHKDGNPLNNAAENIAFLCRQCHFEVEDRMAYRRTGRKSPAELARAREHYRRYNAKRRRR